MLYNELIHNVLTFSKLISLHRVTSLHFIWKTKDCQYQHILFPLFFYLWQHS